MNLDPSRDSLFIFGVDTFAQAVPFLCIGGTRMTRLSHQDLRRNFRQLLASDTCYHTASVFDPMSARIAADLGFEVGILGGSVASLQVLGAPTSP
jgi:hypothetical protein